MIKIEITRVRDNPNFETEMGEYNKRSHYGGIQVPYPDKTIVDKVLNTEITEEEFIKKRKESTEEQKNDMRKEMNSE